MKLLATPELLEKISQIASCTDPADIDHTAFFADYDDLSTACRDGMEALMWLAKEWEIGWEINSGWRCDVPFSAYSIVTCDNDARNGQSCFELQAATPQGALAAGILAVEQYRAAKRAA